MKAGGNDVETLKSEKKKKKKEKKAKKAKKNHRHEGKDEFGRDILPGTTPPWTSNDTTSNTHHVHRAVEAAAVTEVAVVSAVEVEAANELHQDGIEAANEMQREVEVEAVVAGQTPSPIRQIDPFYKPNPESWVSRAGGVYLPKQ
ncbi:hypothetical protein DYB32_003138 [Aphanomyces invadans]|uniref:Uncharacterized protein n=1 Tax=Aphanomyces invadans TaxID=157072 RepID=A0A418B1B3_9STRA|nr:hypothetical protein DYB32_003138 [Aphanomyces invadans]